MENKISVHNLKKNFGKLEVLKDISIEIREGEVVCMIGPSGSGKSTFLRCLNRLEKITSGHVVVDGHPISDPNTNINKVRENIGMVFQHFNLFPHLTVKENITLAPTELKLMGKEEAGRKALELLARVGLADKAEAYPGQLSGGQKQRVAIARALVTRPELVVCDEAVSALDASVQAQVLNLLKEVQADFGLTYFFISHDLSVVGYMSDRVAVMYLGRIVEQADRNTLFGSAAHPYTKALLAAAPVHDPAKRHIRAFLPGELPSPFSPPAGCAFHPRCPQAMPRCREEAPELREIAPDHLARCHLYG